MRSNYLLNRDGKSCLFIYMFTDILIRNTMLMFLGNNDFLSFIKDNQPDCLSSRVLQFFSDNTLQQAK